MYITDEPIDSSKILNEIPDPSCGATAFFVGRVRNHHEGKSVIKLFYDCYRPMAERELDSMVRQVKERFGVQDIRLSHRVGWLGVGESAVAIAVSAPHREAAFSACRALIEEIKKKVPIWKKEVYANGSTQWVRTCNLKEGLRTECCLPASCVEGGLRANEL